MLDESNKLSEELSLEVTQNNTNIFGLKKRLLEKIEYMIFKIMDIPKKSTSNNKFSNLSLYCWHSVISILISY